MYRPENQAVLHRTACVQVYSNAQLVYRCTVMNIRTVVYGVDLVYSTAQLVLRCTLGPQCTLCKQCTAVFTVLQSKATVYMVYIVYNTAQYGHSVHGVQHQILGVKVYCSEKQCTAQYGHSVHGVHSVQHFTVQPHFIGCLQCTVLHRRAIEVGTVKHHSILLSLYRQNCQYIEHNYYIS